MKNIRILDCTLRDGGRIIDCAFPDAEIKDISLRLASAKIDIIEVGFLRDGHNVNYNGNSTFFTDVDQICPFVDKKRKNVLYVAFIDFGLFNFDFLKPYDGKSIDGIRFGFTKKDLNEHYDEILRCAAKIKNCGYKLFIQGVNSLNYSDREILELVDVINDIEPYSFGIVDTYGAMYIDDVDRLFRLIDHNMDPEICINFHSHNNYQLSFSFAQEVIKLAEGSRNVIIDATLGGMGKVAGNLNSELLVDFLVKKFHYDYELDDILDLIDDHIYSYAQKHKWGYSIPAMMAGIYKSHPNNIIYLTEKFRLDTKDISKLLSMIDPQTRQRYDYDNIERLYIEYVADKIDDSKTIENLRKKIEGRNVLVLVPGSTLKSHKERVDEYIKNNNDCVIISVNFVPDRGNILCFFGNSKQYGKNRILADNKKDEVIISSNIKSERKDDIIVNYHSLIDRKFKYFENSSIMLLRLLKRVNPKNITIAGFDGFSVNKKDNYLNSSFQNDRHINEFGEMNKEIKLMLDEIKQTLKNECEIDLLTPSIYA